MMYSLWLFACHPEARTEPVISAQESPPAIDYAAIVAASDRTDADRALDEGRHPADLLQFIGVRPGMRVADLGAGGGYTTELLARAVGPTGVVFGQNSPMILEKFAAKPWAERLSRPMNANVIRADLPFDAPLPPEATGLDAVVMVLFYHDAVWMGVDRPKMNAAVFSALKPGGAYVILDHAAATGRGVDDVQTIHRIESATVIAEVQAAGFSLDAASLAWQNKDDPHDWNPNPGQAGERRGTSDRFALRFVKGPTKGAIDAPK